MVQRGQCALVGVSFIAISGPSSSVMHKVNVAEGPAVESPRLHESARQKASTGTTK